MEACGVLGEGGRGGRGEGSRGVRGCGSPPLAAVFPAGCFARAAHRSVRRHSPTGAPRLARTTVGGPNSGGLPQGEPMLADQHRRPLRRYRSVAVTPAGRIRGNFLDKPKALSPVAAPGPGPLCAARAQPAMALGGSGSNGVRFLGSGTLHTAVPGPVRRGSLHDAPALRRQHTCRRDGETGIAPRLLRQPSRA